MLIRAAALLLATAFLMLPVQARAGGGAGGYDITCQQNPTAAGCAVLATSPGSPSRPVTARPTTASTGHQTCISDGKSAPCSLPGYGWLGANGCYYELDTTWRPPAGDTADQPPPGQAGAYYDMSCLNVAGTGEAIVWLRAGTPGTGPPPSPAELGRQATTQLTLNVGTIEASPSATAEQLVNLPTWLWLTDWKPVTATAVVPGESATATARPLSVTWSLGDGSRLVCEGPGTPYAAGVSPTVPSPTCGHTYTRSSTAEPNGAFPVTVTETWAVTWTGGGQTGTEPPLTATETTAFRVAESQAVNTVPVGAAQ